MEGGFEGRRVRRGERCGATRENASMVRGVRDEVLGTGVRVVL